MDGFETIRASARALRRRLSMEGATGLAVANAAARELELEIYALDAGDPLLKGARATFDHQTRTICYVDTAGPSEVASLLAHEIGHAALHAASSECSADDADPSRSAEMAPVGLQRVEDYGGRERRELQANVFARELLLPRDESRRLHLDERLGATEIADRLVLAKELVRQQLLDSLLLPEPVAAAARPPRARRSDPSQDRAAAHSGAPFLLQAGPGTGKTSTLINRVVRLLGANVDPASIMILTFSNRAATEVNERVAEAAPDASAKIWIGTFHALGLDLVRRYHDRFSLPPKPILFDRSDAIAVLEERLPTLGLKHYRDLWNPSRELRDMLVAISRAKDELVDAVQYRELARSMLDAATDDEGRESAEAALEVARVYELYQQALADHHAVDFGDLIMRPTLLLESDAGIRTELSLRHRHVLVDEYQDVNRASARFVQALAGDAKTLWAVGDSRQSIYRFRGASSVNMSTFAADFEGAKVDQLELNYRSSPEIVETLVGIAPNMRASTSMLELTFEASRAKTDIRPEIRRFTTPGEETAGVVESIRELEAAGVPLRDQAVLCRSNGRLNQLAGALEACGIPVLYLGSIFERDEVRDLLALLSLVAGKLGEGIVRVGAMARYELALQDVHSLLRRLQDEPTPVIPRLRAAAVESGLSESARASVERLASDLAEFDAGSSPWDVLATYLLDRTRIAAELAVATSIPDQMKAIACWQVLNFVRDVVGAGPRIRRVLDRVRMMVLLAEERDLRRVPSAALHLDAVRLLTVHASKGLEFEAVHVPGMTVQSFPANRRGNSCPAPAGMIEGLDTGSDEAARRAHAEEEECLFFVAASRAKTHLRFYAARKQPSGKNRSASPFLDWISGRAVDRSLTPTTVIDTNDDRPVEIAWTGDWELSDSHLKAFDKCRRRYFYTHVLGIGSARRRTAFTRTEQCLYSVIRWLAHARVDAPSEVAALTELDRVWRERGPVDHAFAEEYRQLAESLVRRMVRSGDGLRFRAPQPLAIDLAAGRVVVEADELAEDPDGTLVLRRVRPGFKRKKEADELDYKLLHLAGRRATSSHVGHRVEAVHLSDDERQAIELSSAKLADAEQATAEAVAAIRDGLFPPDVDTHRCTQCPHFFICASMPHGKLSLG